MANAKLEPPSFYRRYGSIDSLYDKLAKRYDFWINDTIKMSKLSDLGPKLFFAKTLKTLYKELSNNVVMQKLLLWEMSADNDTTRKNGSDKRLDELEFGRVLRCAVQSLPVSISVALLPSLISGVYYLILHKERAPFCKIDFNTPEGEAAFSEAVDILVGMLFDRIEGHNQKRESYERKDQRWNQQEKGLPIFRGWPQ